MFRMLFGPATVSDPVLSARLRRARMAVWGVMILGAGTALWGRYTELASKPRIVHETSAVQPSVSSPAPEVRFLLAHKAELGLTKDQERRIAELQAKWEQASGALRSEGVRAAAEAGKQVRRERVTSDAIQRASAPVAAVSAELARLRRAYWDSAVGLLSEDQRSKLRPLMKKITLADLLPDTGHGGARGGNDARRR